MAARKKSKSTELAGQSDPRAPLDSAAFLAEARPVLTKLTDDLLARADASPAVTRALEARHAAEQAAQRTAESFVAWRRSFVDQVAAAWLLSCVFVRTLEDRGLVGQARLAGPGAADSQRLFLELAPSLTERDYLLTTFRELCHVPAARELFDAKHNPVWLLAPSAEAAKGLLQLFRAPHADTPAFRFGQADTRFLGDLYQDLNDDVKKRYALLQTPRFVEGFILDRTLERAIERFGLDDTTLIDPTCGSGHFLLGAFERLVDHRLRSEPGLDVREAARRALDQVFGADINPYAVSIARFRLTLAFLEKAGYATLTEAPALPLHLVVADSLLHNPHLTQLELGDQPRATVAAWKGEEFALEDEAAARTVLHQQYAAVVGNPPYITVKDAVLRDRYRNMYKRSAFREYSFAAPFTERFFQLGREGAAVGMITANSFMKREFGKKLIEEYLPSVNLDLVINTSGAYIPGHGTPTVLLFGTSESARRSEVHTVLASRGEPSTPDDPEQGLVWRSIADHWSEVGFENEYISVARLARHSLSRHPWSLGGGGATELKELLEERAKERLRDAVQAIGYVCITRADDIYFAPRDALVRSRISDAHIIENVEGEFVRDWSIARPNTALFPYDADLSPTNDAFVHRFLWPYRTLLWLRREPNGNHRELGLTWWEWSRFLGERFRAPLKIVFPFVATHNHFVLDSGGRAFKQTAPIIKLPESATEDDHYALLAYLNSSTACFWMKQVFFDKGNRGGERGTPAEPWEGYFEFDGTKLRDLPLPPWDEAQRAALADRGRTLLGLGEKRARLTEVGSIFCQAESAGELQALLNTRRNDIARCEDEIRDCQELLDWDVYRVFRLTKHVPVRRGGRPPGVRGVDVHFARKVASGGAGRRYFELCRLPVPEELCTPRWAATHDLESDLVAMTKSESVALMEQPAFKRTYRDGFRPPDFVQDARDYLLAHIEDRLRGRTDLAGLSDVVQALRSDRCCLLAGDEVLKTTVTDELVRELFGNASCPYLAAHRLLQPGLVKWAAWEFTWSLQRRQDAGENVGEIPAPPKYDQKDYRAANYWRLRGKLDVPKERFISYPGCESDEEGEPVYGWAGWDHAQRARALGTLYYKRKTDEGWKTERLTPMLAGLLELLPWLHQWHAEPDEEYGGQSPARYFQDFLDGECTELGLTHDDLKSWRPPEKKAGRKKASAASVPEAEAE